MFQPEFGEVLGSSKDRVGHWLTAYPSLWNIEVRLVPRIPMAVCVCGVISKSELFDGINAALGAKIGAIEVAADVLHSAIQGCGVCCVLPLER